MKDLEAAKHMGPALYQKELDEKMILLRSLLTHFNDGRRKSIFCIAVNLLDLCDVRSVMEHMADERKRDHSLAKKEKSDAVERLFRNTADSRGISLRLRKKPAQ